jgi:hypothetical protein
VGSGVDVAGMIGVAGGTAQAEMVVQMIKKMIVR